MGVSVTMFGRVSRVCQGLEVGLTAEARRTQRRRRDLIGITQTAPTLITPGASSCVEVVGPYLSAPALPFATHWHSLVEGRLVFAEGLVNVRVAASCLSAPLVSASDDPFFRYVEGPFAG